MPLLQSVLLRGTKWDIGYGDANKCGWDCSGEGPYSPDCFLEEVILFFVGVL